MDICSALVSRENKIWCRGCLRIRSLINFSKIASHLVKVVAMLAMVSSNLLIMVLITSEAYLILGFHRCDRIDVVSEGEV